MDESHYQNGFTLACSLISCTYSTSYSAEFKQTCRAGVCIILCAKFFYVSHMFESRKF